MCRLFGMHAGPAAVSATFWLIDAPDSLEAQSHRNPDGAGVGCFTADGAPELHKQPMAAWQDPAFSTASRDLAGTTFVAHVRYASTGSLSTVNTHPFLADGRLFAHNGVVQGLDELDAHLVEIDARQRVLGQTDSERVFALIAAETRRCDRDVTAGLTAAIGWIGRTLPLYAVNLVLSSASDLWALRYPDTHDLFVLERPAGGTDTSSHLVAHSRHINAHSTDLTSRPAVIVASEPMDDDPAWRPLGPGELLHVGPDLVPHSSTPVEPPRHLLRLIELGAPVARSQHPDATPSPFGT